MNLRPKELSESKFDLQLSWVSKAVNLFSILLKISPLSSSVIVFGVLPWSFWFLAMFLTSYSQTFFQMLNGIIPFHMTIPAHLAYCWLFLGPYLIHRYETLLLPSFLWKTRQFIPKQDYFKLVHLASQFSCWAKKWSLFVFLLTIIMGVIMYPYAEVNFKVPYITHPYYMVSVLLMGLSTFVGTFGFCGVALSIMLIKRFTNCDIFFDVTDPLDRGGLSFVVDFAVKTSLLFASGFVGVLFLYNLSVWITGPGQMLGLILVSIFLLFVLSSFLWPIILCYRMVKKRKDTLLRKCLDPLAEEFHERFIVKHSVSQLTSVDVCLTTWYLQRLQTIRNIPLWSADIFYLLITCVITIIGVVIQYQVIR